MYFNLIVRIEFTRSLLLVYFETCTVANPVMLKKKTAGSRVALNISFKNLIVLFDSWSRDWTISLEYNVSRAHDPHSIL